MKRVLLSPQGRSSQDRVNVDMHTYWCGSPSFSSSYIPALDPYVREEEFTILIEDFNAKTLSLYPHILLRLPLYVCVFLILSAIYLAVVVLPEIEEQEKRNLEVSWFNVIFIIAITLSAFAALASMIFAQYKTYNWLSAICQICEEFSKKHEYNNVELGIRSRFPKWNVLARRCHKNRPRDHQLAAYLDYCIQFRLPPSSSTSSSNNFVSYTTEDPSNIV
eukprot:TRINITY_DN6217_c0_g2_i1.p1 TRINITY_DN6217_c0_g2~~TRINITY_DN6217_c0_g2_i1.p1  ORF type:complete len:220 (+),score=17.99 TRINITY_DN6217_c0_g2_i1:104-763(+)